MARMSRVVLLALLGTLLLLGSVGHLVSASNADEEVDDSELEGLVSGEEGSDGEDDAEEVADEKDVVILGANDFADFVKNNKYVMAEFYAPWCGHCKSLAPEYAKAATALKESGAKLAKVDATEHSSLAQEYGVEGYPTMFFFIDGEKRPFNGGRNSDDIVTWVKKKMGPAVNIVKSVADAEEVLENQAPIAVAYVESVEGADAEEFIAAARIEDAVDFYMTTDEQTAKKFGLDKKAPALVLLKKQNEKVSTFGESFERKAIGDFVSENKLPLVIVFTRETAEVIFESDVTRQLLLFANPEEYQKIRADYEEAAKSFKRKITFVLVNLADEEVANPVLDFFALDNEKTRLLGFTAEESSGKYLYDGDFSADSFKQFSEKFLAGELTPFRKSQSPPKENDGPVKIVVSSTFDEIVLDESKDVVLEVYAPWCGHCQSLEPEYNKLGEVLGNISSIVIAKMDGTKNEHERLKIEGYPTILFFPAGDKSVEPTPLDTERTAAGIVKYLKEHATHKFEAPDVPEPEPELEQDADVDYSGEADESYPPEVDESYPEVDEGAEQEVEEQVTPVDGVKDLKDEL